LWTITTESKKCIKQSMEHVENII